MSDIQLKAPATSSLITREEPWDLFWPDAEPLARAHWKEVETGVEPRRPYAPDAARMRALNVMGMMRIFVARRGEKLVGYFTWMVTPDLESQGLIIANQGAWYVSPQESKAAYCLFEYSIASLKLLGVKCLFPHHRLQGRGAAIGRFFERWRAKEVQRTYCLWIGD